MLHTPMYVSCKFLRERLSITQEWIGIIGNAVDQSTLPPSILFSK